MKTLLWKYQSELKLGSICLAASALTAFAISFVGIYAGIAAIGLLVILFVLLLIFNNYRNGFLLLVIYAFSMFQVYRVAPALPYFPLGVVVEILLFILLAAILAKHQKINTVEPAYYKNPVCYALLLYCVYSALLLFNPASKAVMGRIVGLREITSYLILFIVSIHIFQTYDYIYFFTRFWIILALLAALYGIKQEIFGLTGWELKWLYAQPDQGRLAIVWGHIRKWSFLSDINAFGLLMAYGGIVCLILALGPFTFIKRALFGLCGVLILTAMTFSGTRTATAMVVVGLAFYVAMTLYDSKSIALVVIFFLGVVALFTGPFYGPNFNRLRSTFQVSSDPSMNVRDKTRERMQPYARSHPFGGGINTTGALGLKFDPDHQLAGNWDTDSGYLKTALERGWLGLILQLGLYTTIVIYGLNFFYTTKDPVAAIYCSAYLCGFFALTVANYSQDSLDQKPINLIVMASVASIISFTVLEKKQNQHA